MFIEINRCSDNVPFITTLLTKEIENKKVVIPFVSNFVVIPVMKMGGGCAYADSKHLTNTCVNCKPIICRR